MRRTYNANWTIIVSHFSWWFRRPPSFFFFRTVFGSIGSCSVGKKGKKKRNTSRLEFLNAPIERWFCFFFREKNCGGIEGEEGKKFSRRIEDDSSRIPFGWREQRIARTTSWSQLKDRGRGGGEGECGEWLEESMRMASLWGVDVSA